MILGIQMCQHHHPQHLNTNIAWYHHQRSSPPYQWVLIILIQIMQKPKYMFPWPTTSPPKPIPQVLFIVNPPFAKWCVIMRRRKWNPKAKQVFQQGQQEEGTCSSVINSTTPRLFKMKVSLYSHSFQASLTSLVTMRSMNLRYIILLIQATNQRKSWLRFRSWD